MNVSGEGLKKIKAAASIIKFFTQGFFVEYWGILLWREWLWGVMDAHGFKVNCFFELIYTMSSSGTCVFAKFGELSES